jgi:mono/diheme cytochrome c family protein
VAARNIGPVAVAAALAAVGCVPGPEVGPYTPNVGDATPATFTAITQEILVPRCATSACHSGNPPPNAPVSLDADRAWQELVGVPAQQAPLALVEPGDPSRSYLVLKLRGTASDVGGLGTPMPINDELLTEAQLLAIEAWILNGAPND